MYDSLRSLGHTHEQASAALAHARAESSFNPRTVGDHGTAHGFFQMRGERWQNAQRMARQWGLDPRSPEAAARFLDWELRNDPRNAGRGVGQRYFGARTTEEAVTALNAYERFRGWQQGQPRRSQYGRQFETTMSPGGQAGAGAPAIGGPAGGGPAAGGPGVATDDSLRIVDATGRSTRQSREMRENPTAIITHHTGGSTLQSAITTLNQRGLAYNYIVDRDGTVHQFVPTGRQGAHMRSGWGETGRGLGNQNTIGISAVGTDERNLTPAQIAAMRALTRRLGIQHNIPPSRVYGHGEVNPGHRHGSEGQTTYRWARGLPDWGAGAGPPPAVPPTRRPPDAAGSVAPTGGAEAGLSGRELDPAIGGEFKSTVEGSGRITVDVNAPRGTTVGAEAGGIFKQVEINRMQQMTPSSTGEAGLQ